MISYLLDEHIDPFYRSALARRSTEMNIWLIGSPGAPPKGTLDPEILLWCEENGFILVTNNRKSMPQHLKAHLAEGRHVPGIFIVNPDMSIGETIEELLLIWGASTAEEYQDKASFLPISR